MIYQIVITILLVYTTIVTISGISLVYILETSSNIQSWYKDLDLTKEEAIRRLSFTVDVHFILMLVCAGTLLWEEYNVF